MTVRDRFTCLGTERHISIGVLRTAFFLVVVFTLCRSYILAQAPIPPPEGSPDLQAPGTETSAMNDDLKMTTSPASAQAAWRGIVPGRTTIDEVMLMSAVREDIVQRDERAGHTKLIFPPGCEEGDKRINKIFGRIIEVSFDTAGVCEYIHFGGFFKEHRPTLEELSRRLSADFGRPVSRTSAYSSNSGVYNLPERGIWVIASNVANPTRNGEHEILSMRYYPAGKKVSLPLPKRPYKR